MCCVRFYCLFILVIFSGLAFALDLDTDFSGKQEDAEMQALRKWIRQKRMVTVKEIGGDLSLSGEVRVQLQDISELRDGVRQRGLGGATIKPAYSYAVSSYLLVDYKTKRTWAVAKLKYSNAMGVSSGTTNRIALDRAYLGGRAISDDSLTLDFEIGRRIFRDVFDSKVAFASIFDGILMKLDKSFEKAGDSYFNAAVFIVDDRSNHYGYAGEIGLMQIGGTGLYSEYSFISWRKGYDTQTKFLYYNYRVSHLIFGYQFELKKWRKLVKLDIAGLCNHSADPLALTDYRKQNLGWYASISIGRVRKMGDWAFSLCYQYMQPQVVPDFDVGGIKRGNAAGVGLYTANLNGSGAVTTRSNAVGSCNYKGYDVSFLYAVTGNMTMQYSFQISQNEDRDLGPLLHYKMFKIGFIYAF